MAVKKNCKSKCIFFDFFWENLEIAPKQGKNSVEVVKVITFIRGVYEINNFRDPQLYESLLNAFFIINKQHTHVAEDWYQICTDLWRFPPANSLTWIFYARWITNYWTKINCLHYVSISLTIHISQIIFLFELVWRYSATRLFRVTVTEKIVILSFIIGLKLVLANFLRITNYWTNLWFYENKRDMCFYPYILIQPLFRGKNHLPEA